MNRDETFHKLRKLASRSDEYGFERSLIDMKDLKDLLKAYDTAFYNAKAHKYNAKYYARLYYGMEQKKGDKK